MGERKKEMRFESFMKSCENSNICSLNKSIDIDLKCHFIIVSLSRRRLKYLTHNNPQVLRTRPWFFLPQTPMHEQLDTANRKGRRQEKTVCGAKLCGAKTTGLFAPKTPTRNLCPLAKGWGSGKSF
jgi:hypothetical protein